MNPEHLLEQADLLIGRPGRPRQANLRRAVSAAYYAVFHFTLKSAAERVIGPSARRNAPDVYARVYRATDHGDLRNRLNETRVRSINPNIGKFATAVIQLQQERHRADYDPLYRAPSKANDFTGRPLGLPHRAWEPGPLRPFPVSAAL